MDMPDRIRRRESEVRPCFAALQDRGVLNLWFN
jgi:hypothetical protein